MRRIILPALLATLLLAPPALADGTTTKIIRDCALDSQLDGHYTIAQLRAARAHLPTDVDEYSDCRDVLSRAIAAATQSSGAPSGGGGASGAGPGAGSPPSAPPASTPVAPTTPATPQDQAALTRAAAEGAQPVQLDGRLLKPGSASLVSTAGRNPLPTSMLIVLVLLAATGLAAVAPFIRRHVRPRPPA